MTEPREAVVESVDLVLTSPPYANAQRYTRSLRLEMFVLGITENSATESALDRLQVGTERISFSERDAFYETAGSSCADRVVRSIRREDPYRAAIVGKYVQDMKCVLQNCFNALKPNGHAVLVLGNNSVRGRVVDNAQIALELGANAGFSEVLRLKNRIPSRGLITKRHHSAGVITHEHVLVLKKPRRLH
jgi:DNA modification methylase